MTHDIDKVKLIMERLSGRWSFTGQELDWRVTMTLDAAGGEALPYLLLMVKAYGAMAAAAGDAAAIHPMPDEWDRMFKHCGQQLMFELPERLPTFKQWRFNKSSRQAFLKGWGLPSLPSLPR